MFRVTLFPGFSDVSVCLYQMMPLRKSISLNFQQHEKSYGMGMNMTLQCKNTP